MPGFLYRFRFPKQVPSMAGTLTTTLSPQTYKNICRMRPDIMDEITSKQSLK